MNQSHQAKNLRFALGDTDDPNNQGCSSRFDNRDVFVVIGDKVYNITHVMTTSHLAPGKYGDRKGVAIFAEPADTVIRNTLFGRQGDQ